MRALHHLRRTPLPVLVKEALWRTQRNWKRRRLPALLRLECPVRFRHVGYHTAEMLRLDEASARATVAYADLICQGKFPFLGHGTADLGFPPEWNRDFVSGKEWPVSNSETITITRFDGSDVKVPWDLSRLQFAPVLAKVHLLTGEERYRKAARDLVANWIDQNPVGLGINWTLAMEAALRAISICFLVDLLWPLRPDEQTWLDRVTRSLWDHFNFIEAHNEFSHLIRSNHYLSNVVGLHCLATFLEGGGMQRRRAEYQRRVQAEMSHQVYADGGDKEASTGYHVLVMEMFTVAWRLMRASGNTPAVEFTSRLRRMYDFTAALAGQANELPHIGDCDDGRVELRTEDFEQMVCLPVERRNSLRVTSLVRERATFADAGMQMTIPADVADARDTQPFVMMFPESGIAVVRQSGAELLFLAMPNGLGGHGSHTHNDKLSVVLRLDGHELLCDSGTCVYTRDLQKRNRYRATSAHNTIMLNGMEQNRIPMGRAGAFALFDDAAVSCIDSGLTQDGVIRLQATHSGYRPAGVLHSRTVQLHGTGMEIDDTLSGITGHDFEANLHIPAEWTLSDLQAQDGELTCTFRGPRSGTITFASPVALTGSVEPCLISRAYGAELTAHRIRVCGRTAGDTQLFTRIVWNADAVTA